MASGKDFTYFVVAAWPLKSKAAKEALVAESIQTSVATVRTSLTAPWEAILKCRKDALSSVAILSADTGAKSYTHDEILSLIEGNPHWEAPNPFGVVP